VHLPCSILSPAEATRTATPAHTHQQTCTPHPHPSTRPSTQYTAINQALTGAKEVERAVELLHQRHKQHSIAHGEAALRNALQAWRAGWWTGQGAGGAGRWAAQAAVEERSEAAG